MQSLPRVPHAKAALDFLDQRFPGKWIDPTVQERGDRRNVTVVQISGSSH
jgi:hypothetical protein